MNAQIPEVGWIEAADNPWGVRVLDVRPVTLEMISMSSNPKCAENLATIGQEDGTCFLGEEPETPRAADAALRFPMDRVLADGVLFTPNEMEEKWAIFYHRGQVICVRSWTRKVMAVAGIRQHQDHLEITHIRGTFWAEDEAPEFTARVLDYLLRSHALETVYPAPLPAGMEEDPKHAAMWCMTMFGNRASFATPAPVVGHPPERPLRTHSLLHIAVARGQTAAIDAQLAAGMPIDLLAGDGLAPLHWALAHDDLTVAEFLLSRGSPVDVRSSEGATPLMNAVQGGSIDQVGFFLGRGADVNARDLRGFTALHRAAEMGRLDVVQHLLERGADISPEAEGHTPQSLAQGRGNEEIVKFFNQ